MPTDALAQPPTRFRASLDTLRKRAWSARNCSIAALFAAEPERLGTLSFEAGGLYIDLSRSRLPLAELPVLWNHAQASGWDSGRQRMFSGEPVNTTENRAALHVALRSTAPMPLGTGGVDVAPAVAATLRRMRDWCTAVRDGSHRGVTRRP